MIRKTLGAVAVTAAAVLGTIGVASAAPPPVTPVSIPVTDTGAPQSNLPFTLSGLTAGGSYDLVECYQTPATLPTGTTFVLNTYCTNPLTGLIADSSGNVTSPSNGGIIAGPLSLSSRSSFHTIECDAIQEVSTNQQFNPCFLRIITHLDTTEGDAFYVTLNFTANNPQVPEAPFAVGLPLAGLGVLGIGFLIVRNRRRSAIAA
jgi:hypothetical protein